MGHCLVPQLAQPAILIDSSGSHCEDCVLEQLGAAWWDKLFQRGKSKCHRGMLDEEQHSENSEEDQGPSGLPAEPKDESEINSLKSFIS